jgi:myo-inositol-1(or 4)-monophosphatase
MNTTELDAALAFAHTLADDAGNRLLGYFGQVEGERKADGTLVTLADLEVDRALQAAIHSRYPAHGIISEEDSGVYGGEEHCWVLDPLDATVNFVWGLPIWGVSIALLEGGTPVLGVADFPALRQRFYARRGGGAFMNDRPIRVRSDADLDANALIGMDSRSYRRAYLNMALKVRILGSAVYDLLMVANGTEIAATQSAVKLWDVAAAWLICKEASATVANAEGQAFFPLQPGADYMPVKVRATAAASAALWQQVESAWQPRVPSVSG